MCYWEFSKEESLKLQEICETTTVKARVDIIKADDKEKQRSEEKEEPKIAKKVRLQTSWGSIEIDL